MMDDLLSKPPKPEEYGDTLVELWIEHKLLIKQYEDLLERLKHDQ